MKTKQILGACLMGLSFVMLTGCKSSMDSFFEESTTLEIKDYGYKILKSI